MKKVMMMTGALAAMALQAETMLTPWGEKVTPENAWRGYPRPQMVRSNWTNLNGQWDYAITDIGKTDARPEKWDGKILVPFALEAPLSGCNGKLLEPHQYLWYTRKINLDPKPGEKILLHFGAVDFRAIVYLGHDEVGCTPHEGGQLPFTVDLTPYAKKGENTLTVLVWDPTEAHINSRGKQSFKTYACFYTRMSGIWQTVWMETIPEKHIADYDVTPDIDAGTVTLKFKVCGLKYGDTQEGEVRVLCDGGNVVATSQFKPGEPCTIKMSADFKLWSPETPNLYDFTAKFGTDEIKGYFGMRKFEKRMDSKGVLRFFLNNKPYYVMGTLDQGWWPDGLLTPPSEEAMAFDIQTLKDCGFNAMRKHIKVEPLRYYALCDKMGLLLLQDMPSTTHSAHDPFRWEATKDYDLYRRELKGLVDLLRKVPSIVIWVPFEGGSTFQRDKKGRTTTQHLPTDQCEAADIVDYHAYRGPAMPPVNARRVSFLGEFGGLGHPVAGHIWREFDQGKVLGEKTGSWGYGGIEDTKTREGLEKTYLGLIEKLGEFAGQGLAGSIYTQTTDVEIEINGLLTYDRKVLKYNPAVLKAAHERVIKRAAGE